MSNRGLSQQELFELYQDRIYEPIDVEAHIGIVTVLMHQRETTASLRTQSEVAVTQNQSSKMPRNTLVSALPVVVLETEVMRKGVGTAITVSFDGAIDSEQRSRFTLMRENGLIANTKKHTLEFKPDAEDLDRPRFDILSAFFVELSSLKAINKPVY